MVNREEQRSLGQTNLTLVTLNQLIELVPGWQALLLPPKELRRTGSAGRAPPRRHIIRIEPLWVVPSTSCRISSRRHANKESLSCLTPLLEAFHYYLKHQDELVEQYDGKLLAIKDNAVIGVYDSDLAIEHTAKTEKFGNFIVQLCSPVARENYRSRVVFAGL